MSKIVFVGSNPSQQSNSVKPFWHDTRSNKVLNKWFDMLHQGGTIHIESIHYLNVSDRPTPGNRPLTNAEINENLARLHSKITIDVVPDKVIALGRTAEKALTLLHIEHFAMPHPSGLNRLLNDPLYIEEKINGLREYLKPSKIE